MLHETVFPDLLYLINPEPGQFYLKAVRGGVEFEFLVSPDQMKGLAMDAVAYALQVETRT